MNIKYCIASLENGIRIAILGWGAENNIEPLRQILRGLILIS